MMITVNVHGEHITGFANSKPFSVLYDEQKYEAMKALEAKANSVTTMDELKVVLDEFEILTRENYKEIVEHAQGGKYLWVNRHTGNVYLTINGKVSKKALPLSMVDRIILSVEKKIDVSPLVKNWARFLRNPWYNDAKARNYAQYINTTVVNYDLKKKLTEEAGMSDSVAEKAATMYDVSFTNEGLLATYKVVEEIDWKYVPDSTVEGGVKKVERFDFTVDEFTGLKTYTKPEFLEQRVFQPCVQHTSGDAFYSADYLGHIIRVGKEVFLDSWDKVNCNDSQTCVKGLHIGGLRYIKNYQDEGTLTLNVFVDPMYIGGIDHNGTGALRVLRYFPHSALDGVTQNLYHSSKYAELTDKEYEKLLEEAVTAHDHTTKQALEELEEKKSLLGK